MQPDRKDDYNPHAKVSFSIPISLIAIIISVVALAINAH